MAAEKDTEKTRPERPDRTPVDLSYSIGTVGYLDGYRQGYDEAWYCFTKWMLLTAFILVGMKLILVSTRDE